MMFGELPKLLDRNYLIGFFLPAALLSGFALWALGLHGLAEPLSLETNVEALIGGTLAIGVVWLVSILLMALNYPAYRILQGYGAWNPLRLNRRRMERSFERTAGQALLRQAAYEKAKAAGKPAARPHDDLAGELRDAADCFPDDVRWVLPTAFGNRMRAAEVYARAIYGLDAVPLWPRLQGLLTPEFKELFNAAKAQLDFCVNLTAGGALAAAFYLALGAWQADWPSWWPLACAVAAIAIGQLLCLQAVRAYGLYLRAAFDLHRAPLAERLGLAMPDDPAGERRMWGLASRMMIYRSPQRFDELGAFRMRAEEAGGAGAEDGEAASAAPAEREKAGGAGAEAGEHDAADVGTEAATDEAGKGEPERRSRWLKRLRGLVGRSR